MPERVWEIMKIGFTGPFCDNNFGDYAMLINNIMDIDNAYGDSVEEYVVFCYNISFIDAVVSHYLPDIPLRTVEVELELEKEIVSAQPRISGNSKNFEIIYSDADLSVQGLMDATQNMKEISEMVHGIDILILSGGGCFNYYWLAKHRKARLFKMLIPLLAARSCGKRIVTMGNTFGPWGNENNKGFFREILRAVDFDLICVRDAVDSRKQLNALGVNDNKIRDIADDIYFLNARLKQKHQLLSEKYIIFETYHSMEELEKNYRRIKSFVTIIWERYQYRTVFIPFGIGFGGENQGRFLKEKIPDLILYEELVQENTGFLAIEQAYSMFSGAELVLCDRYHALVLALANNIPCLQYLRVIDGSRDYYLTKSIGIMKKILGDDARFDLFLTEEFSDLFIMDKKRFDHLLLSQKEYFNNAKTAAEAALKEERERFFASLR